MSEPSDAKLAEGTMVGAYRVEYCLGSGGLGTVYAAIEPVIKKRVAIKVLKRSIADDASNVARFEREARAANEVKHPNIVDVFAFGKLADGRPYLVMSLLEGRSLGAELDARKKLAPKEAWRIAREVADALAAAHEAGVIHRDLKPDNVFLETTISDASRPPRVRLLDFGIAKVQSSDDAAEVMKLTGTGVPIGTPPYMAPEQWWCQGVDARTDQYALGVMLFELLAGRRPFASTQFVELVQAHVHETPPKLADVGIDVGEAAEALVARLLAKSGDDRFPSMREVIVAGDAAFDEARAVPDEKAETTAAAQLAHAKTEIARSADAPRAAKMGALVPFAARAQRRYLATHAAIVALGFGALVAIGYAGEAPHDPGMWMRIGGWQQWVAVLGFVVIGSTLPRLARRRLTTGAPSTLPFWLALYVALSGAFGTYTGWRAVLAHLAGPETVQITLFCEGMYEANACRFLGFGLAALLFVSVAAMPAVSGLASATTTLSGSLGIRRREALAGAAALALVALVAWPLGAPSGSFVAVVGAALLAVNAALPTVHDRTAARDELERGLAGLLAIGLAVGVAITRIEAREAALWSDAPTRAARVAEILASQSERTATTSITAAVVLVLVAIEAVRMRRLFAREPVPRPTTPVAILVLVLSVGAAGDIATHGLFFGKRDELRAKLAEQFSSFGRLDPPPGDALANGAAPRPAPALKVAREAVAVNARGTARLAALEGDGAALVSAALNQALAEAPPERDASAGPPLDLSVTIDREVKGAHVATLLRLARRAGVRTIELLLTRGPAPTLDRNGPPEMLIAMPNDFVALRATLDDEGEAIDARATFGDLAAAWIERASRGPLRVAVPREASRPRGAE